jgi:hypothetical protein
MATGAGASSQEPYVVNIVNNNALATETAIIFGYDRYNNVANYGSGANIVITMGVTNVTYAQLLSQSANQPFEVVLTRVKSSNAIQLATSFLLKRIDASGNENARSITTESYDSPDQFSQVIIDIKQSYRIDSQTWLEYQVGATLSARIYFFVAAKVSVQDTLNGKAPIKEFTAQRVRTFRS